MNSLKNKLSRILNTRITAPSWLYTIEKYLGGPPILYRIVPTQHHKQLDKVVAVFGYMSSLILMLSALRFLVIDQTIKVMNEDPEAPIYQLAMWIKHHSNPDDAFLNVLAFFFLIFLVLAYSFRLYLFLGSRLNDYKSSNKHKQT